MAVQILSQALARQASTVVWTNLGRHPELLIFHLRQVFEDEPQLVQSLKQWVLEPPFGYAVPKYGFIILTPHLDLCTFPSTHFETLHMGPREPSPWNAYDAEAETLFDFRNVRDERVIFDALIDFSDYWNKLDIQKWSAHWPSRLDVLNRLDSSLNCSTGTDPWFRQRYLVDTRIWSAYRK